MIDQKAKELGRLLGQSDEYKALKRANDDLGQDRDAVANLQRMEVLRRDAQRMMQRGEAPRPDMERELDELLGKVQVTTAYQRAIVAQRNALKVVRENLGAIERTADMIVERLAANELYVAPRRPNGA